MTDTRDAFGGHPETTKAIEEHRLWHDVVRDGVSDVCWKEATYVRYLLSEVAVLETALRGAPHGPDCVTLEAASERAGRPCDCWKSTAYTALSVQPADSESRE